MTLVRVLVLVSMLSAARCAPSIAASRFAIPTGIAGDAFRSRPVRPGVHLAETSPTASTTTAERKGWPMPLKLLVAEGSIAALSSAGYISEAVGEPPKSGAYVLGASLVSVSGVVFIFIPWALADAQTSEDREGTYAIAVGLVALAAAGGYNLYLNNNEDPTSAQIFRDNMIALNAVPLVTWGVAKVFGWRM